MVLLATPATEAREVGIPAVAEQVKAVPVAAEEAEVLFQSSAVDVSPFLRRTGHT